MKNRLIGTFAALAVVLGALWLVIPGRGPKVGVLDMGNALLAREKGDARLLDVLAATFDRPWRSQPSGAGGPRRLDLQARDPFGKIPDLVGAASYFAEGGVEIGVLAIPAPGVSDAWAERQALAVARYFVSPSPDLDQLLETMRTTGPGPRWLIGEPAKTKGPLLLFSPPLPDVFAASGFLVVAVRAGDDVRRAGLEQLSARLGARIAQGGLSRSVSPPPPVPAPPTANGIPSAFRTARPLVTGDITMGEALRRYREMAQVKGVDFLSMSFPQVPVSGHDANLVMFENYWSTSLLWVTLQVLPEGVLVAGGVPIGSPEAAALQRLPILEIGASSSMPGQLVWSGSLVRAHVVPPKGLVFEVNELALEWRPR
ncbi:MAG: hypothetical protein IPP07_18315 [Holophagales bacterium]|nr:hypothetical protein [Holophagales bacterium]